MLRKTRRTEMRDTAPLSAADDLAMREAFGRFAEGDAESRRRGADVVKRHQRVGPGWWFLCDCLGEAPCPPVLVPVEEFYVRRHYDPPWPLHHLDCDFFSDPSEQRATAKSFRRPLADDEVLLMGNAKHSGPRRRGIPSGQGFSKPRSKLANLLMRLIDRAGLNRRIAGAEDIPIAQQYAALRVAAGGIRMDRGLMLSQYFWTYLPKIGEFKDRIARARVDQFPRGGKPHGVLLCVVDSASDGELHAPGRGSVAVRGKIAVFAETDGHQASRVTGETARKPYLAICLVGRSFPEAIVEVLEAYLHPCVSTTNLMPVDSNNERDTLEQIMLVQAWLLKNRDIRFSIEKPLFHIDGPGTVLGTDDALGGNASPPPVCIPDFILRQEGDARRGNPVVIVETMGFADEVYRHRKRRTHDVMTASLYGAPLVEHDFNYPAGNSQPKRDNDFWKACRWAVSGPE